TDLTAAMPNERSIDPSPSLREFIAAYVLRSERLGQQVLVRPVTASPDVLLIFTLDSRSEAFEYRTGRTRLLPAALIVGPQTARRAEVFARGNRDSVVVRFQPAGFYRLFHAGVEPLADTALDACDVIGPEVGRLCVSLSAAPTAECQVSLVNAFFEPRITAARPRHAAADAALAMLDAHGSSRVADMVRASGLSARQFERAFREQMGISPKLFARAARLHFALGLKRINPTHTWTRVSQEAGYFDQTHFVKDFKALAGQTPSTFPLVEREMPSLTARRPA
ncbi:MAG: helix-turn-helix transcriptional regulator, partial [Vicinamibacterales bacterium]